MVINASYRLSEADYVAYNQRICMRRVVPAIIISIMIVGLFAVVIEGVGALLPALCGAIAGLTVAALYVFVLVPRSAKAIYAEQPSMAEERALAIDADGIRFEQRSGTFRSEWVSIVKWDETPRLLTLFINRAIFIPITKSDVGHEVSDLIRQHLIASGLAKPKRRRSRA